jgi:DNA-nicking Smr family endonuclease
MKRGPDVEDLRLWAVIASTIRPLKPSLPLVGRDDREAVRVGESGASTKPSPPAPKPASKQPHPPAAAQRPALPIKGREGREAPADVEASLHRRLSRGREAVAARIDLHGMTQDTARAALTRFVARSAGEGWRAVLVITGKGVGGDGVLRRRVPDWLAESPIRAHIAGVSEAHRRHGGEGALYVALKRRV